VELAETNKRTWCMRSARGDRHVTLFEVENLADTDNWIFLIELIADFNNRAEKIAIAKIVPDFSITLNQVVINRNSLFELNAKLLSWLNNRAEFRLELSPYSRQTTSIHVGLGLDSQWICSIDKPVFCFQYKEGVSIIIETSFVVDQSCVQKWLSFD
jgi:hypothetical protein